MLPIDALKNGLGYLRSNPMFVVHAARDAARLRVDVPIDLLRWLVARLPKGKGPGEIEIYAKPPALGIGATIDLFGTKLRVTANIGFDTVRADQEEMRIEIRVGDLKVVAPPGARPRR